MSEENKKPRVMKVPLDTLRNISSEFLTLDQISDILGLSVSTLRRWVADGSDAGIRLPADKMGGTLRVHRTVFVAYINRMSESVEYYDPGYQISYEEDYIDPEEGMYRPEKR